MAEPIFHPRTPRGGLNQDDSILTPSPGLAGSLFEDGDYRYARNVRINSTRGSNAGDMENIRGTLEVTDYWAKQRITDVENFNDLSAWEESSPGWSVSAGVLQYSMSAFVQVTPMLFKPLPGSSSSLDIEFSVRAEAGDPPILNPGDSLDELILDVVFLKDGAELSSTGFTFPTDTGSFIDRRVQVSVPQGATHIGLRVRKANSKSESIFIEADVEVNYFNISYTQWQQASRPQGNEKVIGKYSDRETMRLYYAVYNDQGNHCLRYWDPATNRIYELLRWSGLKFEPDYFVKMAKLDNWLAFTDRNNRPRLIDVDTITDLALALGSDFREFHISFHKWAPLCPPIVKTFFTAGQYKFRGKGVFQFSYRYIYYGGLRSRYSPVSNPVPMVEVANKTLIQYNIRVHLAGVILDDPDADVEWTYFGHDSVKFKRAVEYIEIALDRKST